MGPRGVMSTRATPARIPAAPSGAIARSSSRMPSSRMVFMARRLLCPNDCRVDLAHRRDGIFGVALRPRAQTNGKVQYPNQTFHVRMLSQTITNDSPQRKPKKLEAARPEPGGCFPGAYLRVSASLREWTASVRHRINHVVDADPYAQRREFFQVLGIVRMLPGIAQVHVVADGHHQATVVVVDAAPRGIVSIVLIGSAAADVLRAGDLVAAVQVVNRVEDRVLVLEVHNLPVGEHAPHAGHEELPLPRAVEIVAHEKPVAVDEFAHRLDLRIGQSPVTHLHGIEERPIVGIAVIQVDRLLRAAAVDTGQAPHGLGEVAVGPRIVRGPTGIPLRPVAAVASPPEAPASVHGRRIHQARERPLGLVLVIARQRKIVILVSGVLPERPLRHQRRQYQQRPRHGPPPCTLVNHLLAPSVSIPPLAGSHRNAAKSRASLLHSPADRKVSITPSGSPATLHIARCFSSMNRSSTQRFSSSMQGSKKPLTLTSATGPK